jgi:hypothetical protein
MIHPLFTTLATRPELLAEHAGAYAELAAAEAAAAAASWKRGAVLAAVAGGAALLALVWAGVALLLWGALPAGTMPRPWLLWAVPGVALLLALACAAALRRRTTAPAFGLLREQWAADRALWQRAAGEGQT